MADTEIAEIGHDRRRVAEAERWLQLQPVGGHELTCHGPTIATLRGGRWTPSSVRRTSAALWSNTRFTPSKARCSGVSPLLIAIAVSPRHNTIESSWPCSSTAVDRGRGSE